MRIWDIDVKYLCRNHLLGEHRELHAVWKILTIQKGKGGYTKHPETLRWKNHLKALYLRHEKQVEEMKKRRYRHQSLLDKKYLKGRSIQNIFINTLDEQKMILKNKGCQCFL